MGCSGNIKEEEQNIETIKEKKEIQATTKEEKTVQNQKKPGGRRSSLKPSDASNKLGVKIKGNKRHSVSFGQSNTFQFKEMKAMFQENHDAEKSKNLNEKEHKQFVENRRKSIKNEYAMVKELMKKNKNIIEEADDSDEEVKKNTNKNVEIGKKGLNEDSSSSSSSSSNNNSDNEK